MEVMNRNNPQELHSARAIVRAVAGVPHAVMRLLALSSVVLVFWISDPAPARGQATANYEPALRDTTEAEEWDHFFPIWGRKVIEKGFELPLPVGLNVQYLYNYQELDIGNLQLGVNNRGLVDVSDFIDVGHSSVTTSSLQLRPDLWVLPFLNVYGLFGVGFNTVDVKVGKPVELPAQIDREAMVAGFGGNVSAAVSRYFLVLDGNLTWADVDGLDQKSRANVLSGRIGRSFLLPKDMRVAGWLGFMHMGIENNTSGSIRLGDALPGLGDYFEEDYQNSDWYNNLGSVAQRKVDELFAEIAAKNPEDTTIQYALDKQLAGQWSLVLGGQFQFNPHWMLRWEYSHSETRAAFLLNVNYRFGL
jgi:hypothetical protein